jgi:hypothetical protein
MIASSRMRLASISGRVVSSLRSACRGLLLLACFLEASCAQAPPALDVPAADPDAPVPELTYRSTLAGYHGQRPVGAEPWAADGSAPAKVRP